jgi:hypothetical protein
VLAERRDQALLRHADLGREAADAEGSRCHVDPSERPRHPKTDQCRGSEALAERRVAISSPMTSPPRCATSRPLVITPATTEAEASRAMRPLAAFNGCLLGLTRPSNLLLQRLEADRALAKHVKTYAYEFADEDAPTLGFPPVSFPYGAAHGFELPYLFDDAGFVPSFGAAQRELSAAMIRAWTNFAKHGAPGGAWQPLEPSGDGFFASLVPPRPVPRAASEFDADHKCAFWRSLADE